MINKNIVKDYYKNSISVSDMITIILYNNPNSNIKDEIINQASDFIIETLSKKWNFYLNNWNKYYFNMESNILYDIQNQKFIIFLSKLIWISRVSKNFKYFISSVEDYFLEKWKQAEIHKYNYYDKKNNILYINNNDWNITKISINWIEKIKNWDDNNILFFENKNKKWNYKEEYSKNISYFWWDSNKSFIDQLLDSLSIKDWKLSIQEQKLLLKSYFYSIFFNNLFNSKPLLSLIWAKGSGKSFFLEIIQYIIVWKRDLIPIPKNEQNLITNLSNSYLAFYDNVDSKVNWDTIDTLCLACNWWNVKYRKLYSNGEEIEKKLNCYIWLTSRTPHYQRDDLADRTIKIDFHRKNSYNITADKIYDNMNYYYYDDILSDIINELQEIIFIIGKYKNFKTNFRMNEFAKFTFNILKEDFSEEEIRELFEKVKETQEDFANSDDEILEIIETIFENNNQKLLEKDKYYTARQLHEKFYYFKNNYKKYLNYSIKNTNSLGIQLTQKSNDYISSWIEIKVNSTKTWNKKSYRIRKIDLSDN